MAHSTSPGPRDRSRRIRDWALELGFDAVGFAPLRPSEQAAAYQRWVEAGHAGEMGYLARGDSIAKRRDPALLVTGAASAVSAVVVAREYSAEPPDAAPAPPDRAVFARYARNLDYHDVLTPRLVQLQERIDRELLPVRGRAYVDTGAVLERELAVRAGLGWQARNTMHIRPGRGSYHFLGVVLLDAELEYDRPFERDHCGTCERCVSGCPTRALLGRDESGAPIMDARRCISYLTIELKGPIPRELRPLIGNRVYGCDICQEVCPHNSAKFVQITSEDAFRPRQGVHGARLVELMSLSQEEFSTRFKDSPVKRAKRRGLLRNVAVALGNWRSNDAVPSLARALGDAEPLVRGHAAWALGRIASPQAVDALREHVAAEKDEWAGEELRLALREARIAAGSRSREHAAAADRLAPGRPPP